MWIAVRLQYGPRGGETKLRTLWTRRVRRLSFSEPLQPRYETFPRPTENRRL